MQPRLSGILLLCLLLAQPVSVRADGISIPTGGLEEISVSAPSCNPSIGTEGSWTSHLADPLARRAASMIYDSRRDRLVLFGGSASFNRGSAVQNIIDYYNNETWVRPADLSAPWQRLATAGSLPPTRAFHTAIFDPVGDRMIVFGGQHMIRGLRDLWALDFTTDPPTWHTLLAGGTAPPARYDHTAIYDPSGRRMLIFGGVAGDWSRGDYDIANDFWALSLDVAPAWQRLYPSATLARRQGMRSTYDAARARWIISGGTGRAPDIVHSSFLTDVEAIDLATLQVTQLADLPAAPYSLFEHSIDYDASRDQLLVFGGAEHFDNGVYALPLGEAGDWHRLASLNGAPEARVEHSTWFDSARNRLVIFGGGHTSNPLPGGEALSFGRTVLTELDPDRSQPPINPRSKRPVWIVMYGTALLPAGDLDAASIRVGDATIDLSRDSPTVRDVDQDGVDDLEFSVAARDIAASPDASTVPVSASTLIGEPVCSDLDLTRPGHGPQSIRPLSGEVPGAGRVDLSVSSPASSGSARVHLRADSPGHYSIELRSVRGAVVARQTADGPVDAWFDLAAGARLPAGVYWVRVVGPALQHTRRLVITG